MIIETIIGLAVFVTLIASAFYFLQKGKAYLVYQVVWSDILGTACAIVIYSTFIFTFLAGCFQIGKLLISLCY